MHNCLAKIAVFVLLFINTMYLSSADAQSIWLSPDWRMPDLFDLFRPDAPWERAAAHIKVLEIGAGPHFPDDDMRRMFGDLRHRGLQFLLGMLPLSADWRVCGVGVEGYSAKGQPLAVARKIKDLGGEVSYFGMDEPLFHGHVYDRKNACRASIPDLAADVAEKVRQVQSVFPTAQIGDVEPVGLEYVDWVSDLETWFSSLEAATGQKLAFFRADIQWGRRWQPQIDQIAAVLRRKGIPLQIIYNGGIAHSDAEWIAQANEHFREYESGGRPPPSGAVFQTWVQYPSRLLPESDPLTLTSLVNQYVQWRSSRR